MTVVFTIFTGVTVYFVYYNWSLIKNSISCTKFNTRKKSNRNLVNANINGNNKTNKY